MAVTEGPGLAGSLLVGITMAKTLAWVAGLPLVPVNHLEGHIYAAWLLDPDEDERPAPEFPLVALVVSGGHTFLVEMTDHLRYRLLGQTVDDAAGEAFDKVGRLLGLPYPGGPAIMAAASGAAAHDRRFPRAWLGDSYDFSFSGLKTAARRAVGEALGRPASTTASSTARPLPAGGRGRAGLGLPGVRRRRARHEDAAGRARRSARATSSSAAAWPPTACSASASPRAPAGWACRSSCRGPGCAPTTRR